MPWQKEMQRIRGDAITVEGWDILLENVQKRGKKTERPDTSVVEKEAEREFTTGRMMKQLGRERPTPGVEVSAERKRENEKEHLVEKDLGVRTTVIEGD